MRICARKKVLADHFMFMTKGETLGEVQNEANRIMQNITKWSRKMKSH